MISDIESMPSDCLAKLHEQLNMAIDGLDVSKLPDEVPFARAKWTRLRVKHELARRSDAGDEEAHRYAVERNWPIAVNT